MIEWRLLGEAIAFYEQRGYRYVETPWIVPDEVCKQTWGGDGFMCQAGTLVGSAEQGFLAMDLPDDAKLVSCSPCFRTEPVLDELHRMWFMKVELYWGGAHAHHVLSDALDYMRQHLPVKVVETEEGFDIEYDGIELGSYGVRHGSNGVWTYGTGLALPRFTIASGRQQPNPD